MDINQLTDGYDGVRVNDPVASNEVMEEPTQGQGQVQGQVQVQGVGEGQDEMREVFEKIKTHFPPAKVKKIMQSDEDIGKVSQATPVITGRSLEFFIALLVKKSGDLARQRGMKRITADVLRDTILEDEKFDFLRESICAGYKGYEEDEKENEA
ncbi:Negative cofactor 2 complex subunit alpha [Nakaseomyces bracarensis]|uniref:Negative cofactor 2 complex subunit alpha n=1 Tax=Nakaseomyces bracarensis TaxID=273131 RepID=A0ABR4NP40_9SACH